MDGEKKAAIHLGEGSYFAKGLEGVPIHFKRAGEGQPVLLLHGWPGFWYDWRDVIPLLAKDHDVIAPDFRGFGESGKPKEAPHIAYTPEVLAGDMISLLDSLGLKEVIVAAHDIGATVAQVLLRGYPEYFKGAVLLNPPYPGIGARRFEPAMQKEFWYQHLHNLPLAETLIGSSPENVRQYISFFYQHWKGTKRQLADWELEEITSMYSHPGNFAASIQYYRARAGAKTAQAVSGQSVPELIKVRTAVLWGEEDPVIPAAWSDRLGEYFADFKLKTLPGVGHFVPFEAPEEVAAAVRTMTLEKPF